MAIMSAKLVHNDIERKPGESLEVDWAGGTVPVVSEETGELLDAYVFVSALSYSG